eukprot:58476_1
MSVVIEQDLTWEGICANHNMLSCFPTPSVRWNLKNNKINSTLQDFGLNQEKINQEIQTLNAKARAFERNQTDCAHCWCWFYPMWVCIGFVLFVLLAIYPRGWSGAIFCLYVVFFLIVCCGVNNCIISRQKKKWNDRLCHIENYIDHELNPHYEPYHVVWQITPKFVTYGPNNGKYDFSHKIRYYNIKIYPESLAPVTVTVPIMDEETVAL